METGTYLQTRSNTNLSKCSTVQEAYLAHGLAADDKIDRREQVLMFRNVEREMEGELKRLMEDGHFDRAKTLGARLESLRSQFGGLQLQDEVGRQDRQKKLFTKAKKIFHKQMADKHTVEEDRVEQELHKSHVSTGAGSLLLLLPRCCCCCCCCRCCCSCYCRCSAESVITSNPHPSLLTTHPTPNT
jgi:hypothetical protein